MNKPIGVSSRVRVIGGKFYEKLKGAIGTVDRIVPESGAHVVSFTVSGSDDDTKQDSYTLSPHSLVAA